MNRQAFALQYSQTKGYKTALVDKILSEFCAEIKITLLNSGKVYLEDLFSIHLTPGGKLVIKPYGRILNEVEHRQRISGKTNQVA